MSHNCIHHPLHILRLAYICCQGKAFNACIEIRVMESAQEFTGEKNILHYDCFLIHIYRGILYMAVFYTYMCVYIYSTLIHRCTNSSKTCVCYYNTIIKLLTAARFAGWRGAWSPGAGATAATRAGRSVEHCTIFCPNPQLQLPRLPAALRRLSFCQAPPRCYRNQINLSQTALWLNYSMQRDGSLRQNQTSFRWELSGNTCRCTGMAVMVTYLLQIILPE